MEQMMEQMMERLLAEIRPTEPRWTPNKEI
jgi:hypothetical protein